VKIVYFSGTGNTRFISEKLLEKFKEREIHDIELVSVESALNDTEIFEKDIILGIGYPVYDLMPPEIIMEFVNKIKRTNGQNVAFVFSTYSSSPLDSNYYVIEKLQEKGFHVTVQENFKAPGASSYLYFNPNNLLVKGRTIFDAGINHQMDSFVINVLNSMRNNPASIPIKYHTLHKFHETLSRITTRHLYYGNLKKNDSCINCGQCAKVCPASNLGMQNGKLVIKNSNECMRCLRCVQTCNKKAISFASSKRRGDYARKEIEDAYKKAIL
jgi:ferredoxin/flavodoxin